MNRLLFILLLIISSASGFYINTTNILQNTRNISCQFSADLQLSTSMISDPLWQLLGSLSSTLATLRNTSASWNANGQINLPNIFDFCFVVELRSNSSNGTELVSTIKGGYLLVNIFDEYVRRQCSSANFTPSVTPIGYGTCDRLPYQIVSSTLCVCSNNSCNANYASCVASVQANQSPPPPPPSSVSQVIIPTVHSTIACDFNIQGTTYNQYSTIYSAALIANLMYNVTGVLNYQSSLSAACVLLHNVQTGDFFHFPMIYETYSILGLVVLVLKQINQIQNYAETSTSVAIEHQSAHVFNAPSISNLQYFSQILCICTTNNCNAALSSCAPGLNLSQITTTAASTTAASGGGGGGNSGSTSGGSSSKKENFDSIYLYISCLLRMLSGHESCSSK